jgi:hypothetical protein
MMGLIELYYPSVSNAQIVTEGQSVDDGAIDIIKYSANQAIANLPVGVCRSIQYFDYSNNVCGGKNYG